MKLRTVACVALCCLCQGCGFGFATVGNTTIQYVNPPPNLKQAIGRMSSEEEKEVLKNKIKSWTSPKATSSDLLKSLGPPTEYQCNGSHNEKWIYRGTWNRWSGVIAFVLLPIPILLPSGTDIFECSIEDGHVKTCTATEYGQYLMCGLLVSPSPCGIGTLHGCDDQRRPAGILPSGAQPPREERTPRTLRNGVVTMCQENDNDK